MAYKTAKVVQDLNDKRETWPEKTGNAAGGLKDEALVVRAQEDDQWAIEQLVGRYQQKAYAIAYQMCSGDSSEAEDLTQEAFLNTFRNIKKFQGKSSFYTWFYRIVVNTCLDGRRRKERKKRIFTLWRPKPQADEGPRDPLEEQPDTDVNRDPMAVLSGKQLTQEIQVALAALPEKQQTAFRLKVLNDMNIKEIAQIMGSAEGTVKSHLFRATQYVRKALKDWA